MNRTIFVTTATSSNELHAMLGIRVYREGWPIDLDIAITFLGICTMICPMIWYKNMT